jgi:hypothetical protein
MAADFIPVRMLTVREAEETAQCAAAERDNPSS